MYSSRTAGSFNDARRLAAQHDGPLNKKIQKTVWRGVEWTNKSVRGALLNETKGKTWADVAEVNWETRQNLITHDEMCRYAFTIHTEGRSYSGRLPFLLNCDSPAIIHDLEWATHLDHLLIPNGRHQNYIPVRRDFKDLESIVQNYLGQPQDAQRIVANSIKTFREEYTTSEATSCYIRRLIADYSLVSFRPDVTRPTNGSVVRRRGVSFAEFIHFQGDYAGDD